MIEKTSIEKARESRALVEEQLTMRAFEVRRFKKRSTKFQRLDFEDNCFLQNILSDRKKRLGYRRTYGRTHGRTSTNFGITD